MKLSTRTRYGIRAVIELAQHEGKRPLQLKAIAERQAISVKYLEQLMSLLRSSGFVRSVRGSEDREYCDRAADCAAREVWVQVEEAIHRVLHSITLADLVHRVQTPTPSYSI